MQNWTAKSTSLKKKCWKVELVFVITAALWAEKRGRCLEYCKSSENFWLRSTLEAIRLEFWMKEALVTVEFVSSVVGDFQISLIQCRWHLIAAIQLAVSCSELYFTRCCALKRTGTFASESKIMCLFQLILRSNVLMFHSWPQSVSRNILRLRIF